MKGYFEFQLGRSLPGFLALVLLAGCNGSSSSGSGSPQTQGAPSTPISLEPTPAPGPESLTRMLIGPGGGMLEAFGGAVKITIPPGALNEDVDISVQPVAASLDGAVGWAYEFKPDGLAFAKPALLTLQLDNLEGEQPNSQAVALAYQDGEGGWRQASVTPVERQGSNITFEQTHFSKWSFYEQWYVLPDTAEIKAGESLELQAMYLDCLEEVPETDCLLTPISGNAAVSQWSVNGVVNGDGNLGTITEESNKARASYQAPAAVPPGNPVNIAATMDLQAQGKGQLQVVSTVTILSGDSWSGYIDYQFQASDSEVHPDGDGHTETRVAFKSHQDFNAVISESYDDDGNGLILLELGLPTQQYSFERVTDDYYTGEDMEGCVRHETVTDRINKSGEAPVSTLGSIQFNIATGYASTPYVTPPPFMAAGSRSTQTEGCGLSQALEEAIPEDMQLFETYSSGLSSSQSTDGRHFEGQGEFPTTLGGLTGQMKVTWTLQKNQ